VHKFRKRKKETQQII